jgi:hypothetical protein
MTFFLPGDPSQLEFPRDLATYFPPALPPLPSSFLFFFFFFFFFLPYLIYDTQWPLIFPVIMAHSSFRQPTQAILSLIAPIRVPPFMGRPQRQYAVKCLNGVNYRLKGEKIIYSVAARPGALLLIGIVLSGP